MKKPRKVKTPLYKTAIATMIIELGMKKNEFAKAIGVPEKTFWRFLEGRSGVQEDKEINEKIAKYKGENK